MAKPLPLLIALLGFASVASAQDIASYFPAAYRPKAARLLDSIEQSGRALVAKRAAAWEAERVAESEAVEAYALAAASKSSKGPWASPDGSAKSSEATLSLEKARSRARAGARSLASGEDGSAAYARAREEAAQSLADLVRSSEMGPKSALAFARRLSAKARTGLIFPETTEIIELLAKCGASGAREAAAAASRWDAEGIALSLIARREKIVALSPAAGTPIASLEASSRAYRAWMEAFSSIAYPGDASSSQSIDLSGAASGIVAIASLGSSRAAALFEAMESGDGREASAAQAGRVLAETWARSAEPRRRSIATLYGLPEASLAQFCLALASNGRARSPAGGSASAAIDAIYCLRSLNGLASRIAQEEEEGSVSEMGAEASLLLLERPELASVARGESRYASLYAETTRRLDAIYEKSDEDASAKLETAPFLLEAAERALGTAPASLKVRAVNLRSGQDRSERRVAFIATAANSSGDSFEIPVDASTAGKAYAWAFAKASGLEAPRSDPSSLLAKYGQRVVCAYDPEGCEDRLETGAQPSGSEERSLGAIELELALLGGWRP